MWWKDVSRGKDPPGVVNVVVETPMGSRIKYAAEEYSAMVASKLLPATFAYPANSGFFAQCWGRMATPWMPWFWVEPRCFREPFVPRVPWP
jgi:inorganic pyrophosphatase